MISNKKRSKAKHKVMEDEEKMYFAINEKKGKCIVKKVLIKEDEISEEDAKKLIGKNEKLGKEAKYEIVYDKKKKEMKKYKIENGKRINEGIIVPKEECSVYEPLHSYINNK